MNISLKEKQGLLENTDLVDRANKALSLLTKELQMLEMKNEIQSKVKTDLDKQQREYYLNQQMKAIQEELGDSGSQKEIDEMRKRASSKKWSKEVSEEFEKGLKKLQRRILVGRLFCSKILAELILELPWNDFTEDKFVKNCKNS